jgi:signal transduction histidine kinase
MPVRCAIASVRVVADHPVLVSADAGKLRQVIANVVVNAAEATPPDRHDHDRRPRTTVTARC